MVPGLDAGAERALAGGAGAARGTVEDALASTDHANAMLGVATVCAQLGRPHDGRRALMVAYDSYVHSEDAQAMLSVLLFEGTMLLLPYLADDREERRRYDTTLQRVVRRAEDGAGAPPPLV